MRRPRTRITESMENNGWPGRTVLELLHRRCDDGFELPLRDLRAEVWQRSRYASGQRLSAAIAMLERSGLVWTEPDSPDGFGRVATRVGLTQRALELIGKDGVDGALRGSNARRGIGARRG